MPRRSATSRPADTSGASSSSAPWTPERIRDLGAVCSLPTAAQILQISVSLAYQLAERGTFPVPVIQVGTRYRVPIPPLLAALGLTASAQDPDSVADLIIRRSAASMPVDKSAGPDTGATTLGGDE